MKQTFMLAAIRLAHRAVDAGTGGPFGAVVVRAGKIVGRGQNMVLASNDPTAHAEVNAIRAACARLRRFSLDDCELYTSCEPCPMCLAAIQWARVRRVFFAGTRRDAARVGFDDAYFYQQIALPTGKRALPMKSFMRIHAQPAFDAWAAKTDKHLY
jgi:tRNA(Arg) A34 adenosine deaminase TadA